MEKKHLSKWKGRKSKEQNEPKEKTNRKWGPRSSEREIKRGFGV